MQIAILDDDHVIRIARYALSGPGEVSESYVRDFFLPEDMDPARVLDAGRGLHQADGVALIPMAAKFDIRKGSDVEVIIFRRGTVDANDVLFPGGSAHLVEPIYRGNRVGDCRLVSRRNPRSHHGRDDSRP